MIQWLKRLIAMALAGPSYRQPVEKPVVVERVPLLGRDYHVTPIDPEVPPPLPECPPVEQDQKTPNVPKPKTKRRAPRKQRHR